RRHSSDRARKRGQARRRPVRAAAGGGAGGLSPNPPKVRGLLARSSARLGPARRREYPETRDSSAQPANPAPKRTPPAPVLRRRPGEAAVSPDPRERAFPARR